MKLLITLFALAVLGSVASAEAPREPAPDATGYRSPLRETWRDEVAKDPTLKADIEEALRFAVHRDESASFTRNQEHVVYAYIAIWVITAGFLLATFLRQQKLRNQIAHLEADLHRALKELKQ